MGTGAIDDGFGVAAVLGAAQSILAAAARHLAANTLDKVDAEILTRNSAMVALTGVWMADYPRRLGLMWPPSRTAQELTNQQASLEVLGLWPFTQ